MVHPIDSFPSVTLVVALIISPLISRIELSEIRD
jgi:hypothetical protein